MLRRLFLQQALAARFLNSDWKSAPPNTYITELTGLMKAAAVPSAVIGAIQEHKLAWIKPLGVRAAEQTDAVNASTLFEAASLTKQVTAHAAFALRSQGKLDFDRTLVSYV